MSDTPALHIGTSVSLRLGGQIVVGVVTGIDTIPEPGVKIQLQRPVNGVMTCYAAYSEVTVLTRKQAKPGEVAG